MTDAAAAIREALSGLVLADPDLVWSETTPGLFTVRLPGTRKLITECALQVGRYAVDVRAFVARKPEDNEAAVYRWLLQHNLKLSRVAFGLDVLGDIYLTGQLPLETVTVDEIDRLLGIVATTADDSFNPIVELGFAESIRREWIWRRSRGESTANLAAFAALAPDDEEA